ncbi:MAG: quinone-dependent dihydroorotate dehydrogenase [Pseudomonadota bacterium]
MAPLNLYPLLRPLLFSLDPETAHNVTVRLLRMARRIGANRLLFPSVPDRPTQVMGLAFPNPVGLAAGMDKDGSSVDAWSALGFGFLEIGTVTPRPQPGNPRPRIFRIPRAKALINRMGFNSPGVDAVVANLEKISYRGVLGINIGKNKETPIDRAADDYLACYSKVYPFASYVAVNISSPNTEGLRELQLVENLRCLLSALFEAREKLLREYGRCVPLVVKIAPDLDEKQMETMAAVFRDLKIDALIATNTTVQRPEVENDPRSREAGGLSGTPLRPLSDRPIRFFHERLGTIPIIGSGGILSGADARDKIDAGCSLLQVYTGLVYRGPGLIREIVKFIDGKAESPLKNR